MRSQKLSVVRVAATLAALLLLTAGQASAFLLNRAAPVWRWVDVTIGEGRSLRSCEEALAQALAVTRATIAPVTITEELGPGCVPNTASSYFEYWRSDQFQHGAGDTARSISLVSYCEGSSVLGPPRFDSALGIYYCADGDQSVTYSRNIGFCRDCKVGNPVSPGFGNKIQVESDYVGTGPFPLKFERVYNSAYTTVTSEPHLGANWWHTYYRRIATQGPSASNILYASVYRPDGRILNFNLSGGVYLPDADAVERLEKLASGWRLVNRDDEVELFDAQGNLVSISNKAGLSHTISYFASGPNAGLLEKVTDSFGRSLTFEYNTRLLISAIVDPGGGRHEYGYFTSSGGGVPTLTSVKFPDGRTRTYHREQGNNGNILTGITDENGVRYLTVDYIFDFSARIKPILTRHAPGVLNADQVALSYAENDDFSVSPPRHHVTAHITTYVSSTSTAARDYRYDIVLGVAQLASITGPACPSCGPAAQTFDANGNVATRRDWNGNRTNFSYDLARNLETQRVEGLTAAGATTPQTRTIRTQWHATFRLPATIAEPLRITSFTYDPQGNLLTRSVQATTDTSGALGFGATPTGSPRTWTYTYNANGQVLTIDGSRTDVADTTTYTYYANNDADLGKRGNVATITNAAGHTTQITAYNAHGQPLTIVDPNGLTTTLTYDLRQRLSARTVGGEITTYTYDNAGQLIKVTLPDGSFLSYSYDAAHRLTGIQDNLSNRIAYTLDLAGNRTQEQVFDPANALAQTRSRVYSNINRLFQELGAAAQTTEYAYDNQGNVTSVKDPLNQTTSNQYDPLNRLKQVTDPALGVTQYAYNGLDALTQVTDPRSLVTGYTVDGLGNLMQQASPDTGNTVNAYDAAGNLATQTDAKGQATGYAYDALNRVTLITFHDGSKQAYAYDQGTNGIGRLSSITETDPANQVTSAIAYGYDQKGRVTSETRTVNGLAYALAYIYDSSGRLTGLTYPSGRTVTYTLDALGRVNQVTTTKDAQSQIVVQNVQYHPFGGAKSWTLGNGQIYSRAVDQDGRIAGYTLGAANYAIGFDAASRITGISEVGNPANANTYGYDALDRLASAVLPGSNFAYGYDAVGNRLTKTIGANTDSYAYSATSNRIASLTPAGAPPRSFVFDANGSTTSDGLNTYAYDTRGRMVQAVSTVGTTSYQVNALGQRIRKTNGAGGTVFTYDTWGKLIAETDPGGTLKREYLYLGDIPVGVVQ